MASQLTVSKATFLETRIVPANDNDKFYNNRCSFCWTDYSDEHAPARVLPCNHVFGLDCIPQIVDAHNGHLCPLCKTQLFKPSIWVSLERDMIKFYFAAVHYAISIYASATLFISRQHGWTKTVMMLLWTRVHGYMVAFWMTQLIHTRTNLNTRYSPFKLRTALHIMSIFHVVGLCFAPMFWVPTVFVADKLGISVAEAMQRDLGIAIWNILWTTRVGLMTCDSIIKGGKIFGQSVLIQDPIVNRKDRTLIILTITASMCMLCSWDAWVLLCINRGWDPQANWVGNLLHMCQGRASGNMAQIYQVLSVMPALFMTLM